MDISTPPLCQSDLPRPPAGRALRRAAFSIVELAIVLLVLGILAGIAVPKFGSALKSVRARGAAKWIKSDLRYAQRLARQSSSMQTVTFDTATESYVLAGVVDINQRGQTYSVSLNDSKFNAQLETVDFAGSSTVSFDIFGRPDNAGTIVVKSADKTETILVNAEGQITIQ